MNIELRSASETDYDFAREAHHLGYHDVVIRQFGVWDEQKQNDFFDNAWSKYKHKMILANGDVSGYCCIEYLSDYVHVRELVIHPTRHRQGIASALLRMIQLDASRAGLPIRLGVFSTNTANSLYEKLGFIAFDQTETHVLLEWKDQEDV